MQQHRQRQLKPATPSANGVRSRSGFTLVEVLLSLSLALVLMGAVYAAFNMYRQLSTDGRDEAERSQLTRAIQQKMSIDFRSVIYSPPEEKEEEESTDEGEEGETIEIEVTDPADAVSTTSRGVIGNSEILTLHISKPPRGLNYSSNFDSSSVTSRTSDLISVSYFLAGPNSSSELAQLVSDNNGKTGLARLIGDRLAFDQADAEGDIETLAESATILAEEVNSLSFRYFDGEAWVEEWDSTTMESLPRAIEVTIGFRTPSNNDDSAEEQTSHTRRFVIALPVADPSPPADLGF